MGHAAILSQLWREAHPGHAIESGVEFGAGDGTLACRVMARLPAALRPKRILLIDRQPLISPATRAALARLGVHAEPVAADVFAWLQRGERFALGLANLFLHHFDSVALRRLLSGVATLSDGFVAVEPRRSAFPELASRLLLLIGCNRVTRHDAVVSVRAGFGGRELSEHWNDAGASWTLSERRAGLFSHSFCAVRPPAGPASATRSSPA